MVLRGAARHTITDTHTHVTCVSLYTRMQMNVSQGSVKLLEEWGHEVLKAHNRYMRAQQGPQAHLVGSHPQRIWRC